MERKIYLEATNFESKISRKKLEYNIWTFEEVFFNGDRRIYTGRKATKVFFGNKRDTVSLGDIFDAKIQEFKTTTFHTKDNERHNTIAVVVGENENGLEIAARALIYFKAFPYDADGKIYELKTSPKLSSEPSSFNNELEEQLDEWEDEGTYSYNNWSEEEINDIFGGDPDATWNVD